MHGRLNNLRSWLTVGNLRKIRVVLVHDIADTQTGYELRSLVNELKSENLTFIENRFGSPGAARNCGFSNAGDANWIAFWDSDDIPHVEEFLNMIEQAEAGDFNSAIGAYEKINTDYLGNKNSEVNAVKSSRNNLSIAMNPGLWRWAFRIATLEKNAFENYLMAEDQIFIYENFLSAQPNYLYNGLVYSYFINLPGQLTGDSNAIRDLRKSIKYFNKSCDFSNHQKNELKFIMLIRQIVAGIKHADFTTKIFCITSFINCMTNSKMKLSYSRRRVLLREIYGSVISIENKISTVFLFGGLGNQLFQIAFGLEIAKKRQVRFDFSYYSNLYGNGKEFLTDFKFIDLKNISYTRKKKSYFEIKLFNLAIRLSSRDKNLEILDVLGKIALNFVELIFRVIYGEKFHINNGIGFDSTLPTERPSNCIGYFQTYMYSANLRGMELKSPSALFLKDRSKLQDLDSIIVHVRLGDYKHEQKFGLQSEDYYRESIKYIWDNHKFNRICLFSDEPIVAADFIPKDLQDFLFLPSLKVSSAAENLELMRYGSAYVLSNSTFGWWAATLSYQDNPLVITPKVWFKGKKEPVSLIPDNWLRM
jgi:hypothetical protein